MKSIVSAGDHKRNNIDALRLFFSILVLFSHSYPLSLGDRTGDQNRHEPLYVFSNGAVHFGDIAVDAFFVLSGFLIAQSWMRSPRLVPFLRKRVARIYPGFLVASAICLWVVIPLASPEWRMAFTFDTLARNAKRVLMLGTIVGPPSFPNNPLRDAVNGSLWTIPFEFWCYIGVAALGLAGLMGRRRILLGLFLATVAVGFVFDLYDIKALLSYFYLIFGWPRHWARLLPFYMAGVVAFHYRDRIPLDRRLALLSAAAVVAAMKIPHAHAIALPLAGSYLLLYASFTQEIRVHNAAKYGDFSYGIYLYAFPIQQLIMMGFGRVVHPLVLFGLALVPSVIAGALSWYLVERWFLRKSPGRPPVPEPTAAAPGLAA